MLILFNCEGEDEEFGDGTCSLDIAWVMDDENFLLYEADAQQDIHAAYNTLLKLTMSTKEMFSIRSNSLLIITFVIVSILRSYQKSCSIWNYGSQ